MHEPHPDTGEFISEAPPEWFVPCPPMFVEAGDGWALTDAARVFLEPPAPSIADRIAAARRHVRELARDLPAAARGMTPADLLDAVEALQHATNMLGACDQAVVAEIDRRGVHEAAGATSTTHLLADHLRIRPAEAARRVAAARSCAERVSLDGQVLPPVRAQIAAAQATGGISTDHAVTIARALDSLPAGLPVDTVERVEAALVELAGKRNASDVATAGRAARDRFEDDDPEPRDRQQRRRRSLSAHQDDDGMGVLRGTLTADLLAKVMAVLTGLAAPRPTDAEGEDIRSHGQRWHDALEDVMDRLLRSGTLPDAGGVPASVAVTIPVSWLQERTGRVTTTLGVDLSARQFLHLACEAEFIPVVLDDAGGVMSYGRTRRFASPGQTKALRARDRGCSFPGCRRPPEWCERHHVEEWVRDRGGTDVATMTLLCPYHHHGFEEWGWRVEMRSGVPWWIPPTYLDPEQEPLQNTAHPAV